MDNNIVKHFIPYTVRSGIVTRTTRIGSTDLDNTPNQALGLSSRTNAVDPTRRRLRLFLFVASITIVFILGEGATAFDDAMDEMTVMANKQDGPSESA